MISIGTRYVLARFTILDREWYLWDVIRLATALHYSEAMKRAGVPEKRRLKILARFSGWSWALHCEMKGLGKDMARR